MYKIEWRASVNTKWQPSTMCKLTYDELETAEAHIRQRGNVRGQYRIVRTYTEVIKVLMWMPPIEGKWGSPTDV